MCVVVGTSGNLIGSGGYTTLANVHGVHMFFGDTQTKEVFLRASYYRKHSHVDMKRASQSDMPFLGKHLPKQGYKSVSKKRYDFYLARNCFFFSASPK